MGTKTSRVPPDKRRLRRRRYPSRFYPAAPAAPFLHTDAVGRGGAHSLPTPSFCLAFHHRYLHKNHRRSGAGDNWPFAVRAGGGRRPRHCCHRAPPPPTVRPRWRLPHPQAGAAAVKIKRPCGCHPPQHGPHCRSAPRLSLLFSLLSLEGSGWLSLVRAPMHPLLWARALRTCAYLMDSPPAHTRPFRHCHLH